ncbi:SDR family NAD(P)-dependent oxidoreductase [Streptacidiphilus sp. EB129]|uniref:SDR family NAD(P)-dependent oxidoreductase n=1 Tax=Streptacidiphilus sp. EB129 TaxID=3156262 RepID=UPI0035110A54
MAQGSGPGSPVLWPFSGADVASLAAQAGALHRHLAGRQDWEPSDIGCTLAASRPTGRYRAALVAQDSAGFLARLAALAGRDGLSGPVPAGGSEGGVAFVFPGQGSQWPGMALELLEQAPVFRARLDDCAQALEPFTDWSLPDVLRGVPGTPGLERADVAQPALFAVMLSLAALWESYGVRPSAVLGHSMGELCSAVVADALSLDDAARVVGHWSRLQATLAGRGDMVSVLASAEQVEPLLHRWDGRLVVAAVNGPASVIVSGDVSAAAELPAVFTELGLHARRIAVGLAAHSPHIDAILPELRASLAAVRPRPARLPFYSGHTGGLLAQPALDADYWCRNLRNAVRFADATAALLADGHRTLVEVSPHPVLTGALQETARQRGQHATVRGTLRRNQAGRLRMLTALGELFTDGVDPDWAAVAADSGGRPVEVPLLSADPADSPGEVVTAAAPEPLAERLPTLTRAELRSELLALVGRTVADVLGLTGTVDPASAFLELGLDSVGAVEVRNRLVEATGLRLPAALVFDHPRPAALADFLAAELTGDWGEEAAVPARSADRDDPVVIVSMGCRFPGGVSSPQELWQLAAEGVDAVSAFPTNRGWDIAGGYQAELGGPGHYYQREAGFLHDADLFDAEFFGISPREALAMDPQQRLLLETAWETVERSGTNAESLRGSRTGVFIGAMTMDYGPGLAAGSEVEGHLLTGNTGSVASGRLAYHLGLEGAAITVDTACSSSLVALHLATRALRSGECDLALAGGVTVMSTLGMFVEFSRQGGLAPDGRCKAFAAAADGFGLAEGVGLVLLERLSDARRNGHPVLAVLRGSAVNQDGASNGLTAPNGPSQQRVIKAALTDAALTPTDIDAVEAHGTGTRLGDPIEADALIATYGQNRPEGQPLLIGSLKSNIGHTQAAAGVAGVIKMVMALQHGLLPKTLHVDAPSPHIDWSNGAVELLTQAREWPDTGRPRRAGVSSFGVSGTNAHVLLEQAPTQEAQPADNPPDQDPDQPHAWLLSAHTPQALQDQARQLLTLPHHHNTHTIAHTLTQRTPMHHRAAITGTRTQITQALHHLTHNQPHPNLTQNTTQPPGKTIFIYPGQGPQHPGMTTHLLNTNPLFAHHMHQCEQALNPHVPWKLTHLLHTNHPLDHPDTAQPVLFAIMTSLTKLWNHHGIHPDIVIGHSQGEITAAHIAGALTLQDAAHIITHRSQTLTTLTGTGTMASINLPPHQLTPLLTPHTHIAAHNSPTTTIVTGTTHAIHQLLTHCKNHNIHARQINVNYPSHSPHIDTIKNTLLTTLQPINPTTPTTPWYSTTTNTWQTTPPDPHYWYNNLRNPVHFHQAITTLQQQTPTTFIEISPHPTLTPHIPTHTHHPTTTHHTLNRNTPPPTQLLQATTTAWTTGQPTTHHTTPTPTTPHHLPTYPFQHTRYWLDVPTTSRDVASAGLAATGHPLLGAAIEVADSGELLLSGQLSLRTHPWLADHAVNGSVLLPGAAFLELALRAAAEAHCPLVEELTLEAPLVVPAEGVLRLQLRVGPEADGRRPLTVFARRAAGPDDADREWTRYAAGQLAADAPPAPQGLIGWPPPGAEQLDLDDLYDRFEEAGFHYGPAFRGLRAAWRHADEVFAEVLLPAERQADAAGCTAHPALLDAALQAAALLADRPEGARLPFSWTGVTAHATGPTTLRVRIAAAGSDAVTLTGYDLAGRPVLSVDSLTLRPPAAAAAPAVGPDRLFRLDWQPAGAVPGAEWTSLDDLGPQDPVPAVLLADCRTAPDPDPVRRLRTAIARALALVQEWLANQRFADALLVLRTTDAVATGPGGRPADPAQAAVWGLLRSVQSEHPGRFALLDTDGAADPPALLPLEGEPQLAVRRGEPLVPRLARGDQPGLLILPPDTPSWQLAVTESGTLGNLALRPVDPAPLEAGQIRIAVRAAGLNFRDVAVALGLTPDQQGLGSEGAGTVLEVGPGVADLTPGDRVMGIFGGAFGPVAVADRRTVAVIPAGWSFARAASVPIAFLTAYYGLFDLGGLRRGESVLVHSAAGGVGMAAVQLARRAGAEVFGTAGPSKWDALRASGIDDAHLASSRSLDFADHFLAGTTGRGVDLVLDCLAREFVDASLRLLPRGGRFLEMGKTDIRDAREVADRHPGVDYRAFDLMEAGPERIGEMLAEVLAMFDRGELEPLPLTCWDVRLAPDAFRRLGQAGHIGKNVLLLPAAPDPDGTVLVTGGTGTLGRMLARHLVTRHGVRNLVLAGRSGPDAPGIGELLDELAGLGAAAEAVSCDVADRDALSALLAGIPKNRPLTGVVHAAGLLDDAMADRLTDDQVDRVLRPKADAALLLDELTRDHDLPLFVVFSSGAALLGTPGQANYAAANAVLDALAERRRAEGLAGLSIGWGLWEQRSALTARLGDADLRRMARRGAGALGSAEGLAMFDTALAGSRPYVLAAKLDPAALRAGGPALLSGLARTPRNRPATADAPMAVSLADQLAALSATEAHRVLLELVRGHAAAVLGHSSAELIHPGRPFKDLGFDSLTAVELRNRLASATGVRLPAGLVFDQPTPEALAAHLVARTARAEPAPAPGNVLAELDRLELLVAGLEPTAPVRPELAGRLRAVLAGLVPEEDGLAAGIESASNDEIFEFIDRQLGG